MRVLHVVPTYLPAVRYGGPAIATHALCAALVRQGCQVTVFTTNVDGPGDSAVPVGEPVDIEGVNVWYFPVSHLRRLYYSPAMARALAERCRSFELLHLHSVFLWPTAAAARAARRQGVPYLLAPRGMLVKDLVARKSTLLKSAWIALVERRNLEHAAGIHVTSALEAEELRRFGFALRGVFDVPNGVTPGVDGENSTLPAAATQVLESGRPIVLYLGRVSWKKGLDRLIRAMALVPEAVLLVVGNDEEGYARELGAIASQAGVDGRVVFAGPVFGAAKGELYRRAGLLALASYSENFGNVVLEAMGEGCPVVVTPDVGAAQIVRDAGAGLVVQGEPQPLSQAIARLLSSPGLRTEMGTRGRNEVRERYSWNTIAQRMLHVYREVAAC